MYEIDFLSATMADVITRSAVCHPSLFRDAMLAAAEVHWTCSAETNSRCVARIALEMANNLRRMAHELEMDDLDVTSLTLGEKVQAFGVARKLQCLPWSLASDIAAREEGWAP
jgi:hypothetical protein